MTVTADFAAAGPRTTGGAIPEFERAYAARRRRARQAWVLGTTLFLAVFGLTAWVGDFFKVTQVSLPDGSRDWRWIIGAGLPRLGEYVEKTLGCCAGTALAPTLRNGSGAGGSGSNS